jgi:hypothetical protein
VKHFELEVHFEPSPGGVVARWYAFDDRSRYLSYTSRCARPSITPRAWPFVVRHRREVTDAGPGGQEQGVH